MDDKRIAELRETAEHVSSVSYCGYAPDYCGNLLRECLDAIVDERANSGYWLEVANKLTVELEEERAEVRRLREYEFMYKSLCK